MLNKANLVKLSEAVFRAINTQEAALCSFEDNIVLELYPNGDKLEVMDHLSGNRIDSYWICKSQGDVLMTSLCDILLDAEKHHNK